MKYGVIIILMMSVLPAFCAESVPNIPARRGLRRWFDNLGSSNHQSLPAASSAAQRFAGAPTPFVKQIMDLLKWERARAEALKFQLETEHHFDKERSEFLLAHLRFYGKKKITEFDIQIEIENTREIFEQIQRRRTTLDRYEKIRSFAFVHGIQEENLTQEQWDALADRVAPIAASSTPGLPINDQISPSDTSLNAPAKPIYEHFKRYWYVAAGAVAFGVVAGLIVYYYKVRKNKKQSDKPATGL